MIEKYINNELTLKRWRSFKRRRLAVVSCFILFAMLIATFSSPFLANSRPIVMKYKGEYFFPVLKDYHPKNFGITDLLSIDYRTVKLAPMVDGNRSLCSPVLTQGALALHQQKFPGLLVFK